jgi:NAD-dependent SIR2 family protein deacetylase
MDQQAAGLDAAATARGTVEELAVLVAAGGVVVLSGAGMSTASGIPDYRGPTGRQRTAPPMRWSSFEGDPVARRRYWARGQIGFRRYLDVQPNAAHRAVAALQDAGLVDGVVTQNVDGLHQAAGSPAVVEVHGALREVVCMRCGVREPRATLAARLDAVNPWLAGIDADPQADGDAMLDDRLAARFTLLGCLTCDGDLRPDVVFFGEHVPRERMARARSLVEGSRTLLVLGSSLTVGSGWLLVRAAQRHGAAVALVNQGATRADGLAVVRLNGDLTEVLPQLTRMVASASSPRGDH